MKEKIWKDTLEGIGIVAIVLSLVFVGMQLKQNQDLAVAEGYLSMLEIKNTVGDSIRAEAEIWNKAKAGGDLADSEALTFAILVNQINDLVYYNYVQALVVSGDGPDNFVRDFAIFLHSNPSAKAIWLEREEYLVSSRKLVDASADDYSDWKEMVLENLAVLESKEVPVITNVFVDW